MVELCKESINAMNENVNRHLFRIRHCSTIASFCKWVLPFLHAARLTHLKVVCISRVHMWLCFWEKKIIIPSTMRITRVLQRYIEFFHYSVLFAVNLHLKWNVHKAELKNAHYHRLSLQCIAIIIMDAKPNLRFMF